MCRSRLFDGPPTPAEKEKSAVCVAVSKIV